MQTPCKLYGKSMENLWEVKIEATTRIFLRSGESIQKNIKNFERYLQIWDSLTAEYLSVTGK